MHELQIGHGALVAWRELERSLKAVLRSACVDGQQRGAFIVPVRVLVGLERQGLVEGPPLTAPEVRPFRHNDRRGSPRQAGRLFLHADFISHGISLSLRVACFTCLVVGS